MGALNVAMAMQLLMASVWITATMSVCSVSTRQKRKSLYVQSAFMGMTYMTVNAKNRASHLQLLFAF